jgi:putative transposase
VEDDDRVRQAAQTTYQALLEAELTAVMAPPRTSARPSDWPSATATSSGAGDLGRGLGAARRVVLPVAAGAAPAGRPGLVHGGDGGLPARRQHPQGRRPGPALGADSGISKSEVSRICADLDHEVAAFGDRSLPARPCRRAPGCHLLQGARQPPRRRQAVVVAAGVAGTAIRWCSASAWATPRMGRSGRRSCVRSRRAGWPGAVSSGTCWLACPIVVSHHGRPRHR